MHPGLVVKLRPSGPWRIGPDSGARNRVDVVYHSDSLYSAVTSAMARLGSIEEWLDATGRAPEPVVCFSSCFPLLDDIAYVVPPRTVWPPASQASSARVRWKSARFVPLGVVQAILAGRKLDENQWTIDGPSECLAPAGSSGPFRTAVRWSAAVDRLTGVTERHATACLEFRPGCGLWTVASFADEAARDRWQEPIKAAFRLLADTGFGGERSRGWGRSEPPEFVEGTLPELILPAIRETVAETAPPAPVEEAAGWQAEAPAPQDEQPAVEELAAEPAAAEASVEAPSEIAPLVVESGDGGAGGSACQPAPEPTDSVPVLVQPAPSGIPAPDTAGVPEQESQAGPADESPSEDAQACEAEASACPPALETTDFVPVPEQPAPLAASEPEFAAPDVGVCEEAAGQGEAPAPFEPSPLAIPAPNAEAVSKPETAAPAGPPACGAGASACQPEPIAPNAEAVPEPESPAAASPLDSTPPEEVQAACQPDIHESPPAPPQPAAAPEQLAPAPGFENAQPHWLLSLFTPAPADAVDWKRGDYALLSRGGRVESPAGSGELKKQVHMVAEGSVLFAVSAPRGLATDVAPDGFAHPVYRAGFAVAVPLEKGS
jgi:CRISPR type III-A-associated RAMP protein Csm4